MQIANTGRSLDLLFSIIYTPAKDQKKGLASIGDINHGGKSLNCRPISFSYIFVNWVKRM